jgi:hypothetical protein
MKKARPQCRAFLFSDAVVVDAILIDVVVGGLLTMPLMITLHI